MGVRDAKKIIKAEAEDRLEIEDIPVSMGTDVTETVIHPPAGEGVEVQEQDPKPLTRKQEQLAREAEEHKGLRPEGLTDEQLAALDDEAKEAVEKKQGHVIQHTPRTGPAGTVEGDVMRTVAPRGDEGVADNA